MWYKSGAYGTKRLEALRESRGRLRKSTQPGMGSLNLMVFFPPAALSVLFALVAASGFGQNVQNTASTLVPEFGGLVSNRCPPANFAIPKPLTSAPELIGDLTLEQIIVEAQKPVEGGFENDRGSVP